MRPADTVDAVEPGRMTPKDIAARALSETDPALLDQLLALPQAHLVVDGYNVTKTGYPTMPLEKQRLRLLGGLSMLAAQTGAEMTCVFDGAELAAPVLLAPPRGVRVLFSKPGVTADELIRQLVRAEPPGRPVVVVSTDREVADGVAKAGARPVASAVAAEAAFARLIAYRPGDLSTPVLNARIRVIAARALASNAHLLRVWMTVKNASRDRIFSDQDLN